MTLTGMFKIMAWKWLISVCLASRSSPAPTSRPTLRSVSSRSSDGASVSIAKKSIVPTTSPLTRTGKHPPLFTPARFATGARQQSVISPMSDVKNRSRDFQARPESPSPSRKRASLVMR